jgi:predicted nucleic acid-binding protein
MKYDSLVDTSGFYALLVKRDAGHGAAGQILRKAAAARRRFVTTDYVLDETATLLKVRGLGHLLEPFFQRISESESCRVERVDEDVFARAQRFFLKHRDQPYSFTDCTSFVVMRALGIKRALTKDAHFRRAGFTVLLG